MSGATAKAQNLCLNALLGHPQRGPLLVQKAKLAKPGQARRAVLTPDQRTWAFNYVKNTVWKVLGGEGPFLSHGDLGGWQLVQIGN